MSYLLVFSTLILFSFLYKHIAIRNNIIAEPNNRGMHNAPIIIGGGWLFYVAVLLFYGIENINENPIFFIGLTILSIVSFIDDLRGVSVKIRLLVQILSLIGVLFSLKVSLINSIFLLPIGIGFINAFNFMDGVNGMIGLNGILSILSFYYINSKEYIINKELLIFLLLALLVFNFYNSRKKVQMFAGDVGSIALGFIIFFILMNFVIQLKAPVLFLFFIVFGIDVFITILYRLYLKENILQPHKHHLYQKLVAYMGLSHLRVSFIYLIVQTLINCVVFLVYKKSLWKQGFILLIITVVFIVIYFYAFKVIKRKTKLSIN